MFFFSVRGQNIEQIKDNDPIQVTGGCSASSTIYSGSEKNMIRDPFVWVLNGNFNLNFYGVVNAPVSFFLSKDNRSLDANTDAFKRFGISPQYRSVTLHLGYRNMEFSRYTLSGITFLGGGIEYAPVHTMFKIKSFYGQFAAAKQYKTVSAFDPDALNNLPVFERRGYGTMLTLGKKGQFADIILFKGQDDKNSITIPDSINVKPAENFVIGFRTRNSITNKLHLKVDYSLSAFTTDTRQPRVIQESYTYANNLGFLFTPRTSSQFNNSVQAALDYVFGPASIGLSYNRVDPQYQSLGTSFINNDIEEVTADFGGSFLKNKISISGNFGFQHNNLDNSLLTTSRRLISSFNCTWLAGKKLNFTGSFSNFNSSALPTQILLIDSIKYTQATTNLTLSSNYHFEKENSKQGITLVTTYQKGNTLNQSGTQVTDVSNSFLNTNLMYRLGIVPGDVSIYVSVNFSVFTAEELQTSSLGPTLGVTKSLFKKKVGLTINTSFLNTSTGSDQSFLINNRVTCNWQISSHHSFRMGIIYLDKSSVAGKVNQFQGNLAYNFIL